MSEKNIYYIKKKNLDNNYTYCYIFIIKFPEI